MPYVKQTVASGDTITSAWGNQVQTQYDEATEEGLRAEDSVIAKSGEECTQVETTGGVALEFADGAKQTCRFSRRWPWTGVGCKVEARIAMDTANAGNVRLQVAYSINGAAPVNVGITVTPGSDTNQHTVDLGEIIAGAGLTAGDLVSFEFSRLGADGLDTHTGKLRVYYIWPRRS